MKTAAVFMILSLLWLTISLPIVYKAQQQQTAQASPNNGETSGARNSSDNPFANTTEEKAPSSVNLTEEYLHHHDEQVQFDETKLNHSHAHSYDVYIAFHGELLSPPPEA